MLVRFMTYEEIYNALYRNGSEEDKKSARWNIIEMDDDNWHGWIKYRNEQNEIRYREKVTRAWNKTN